MQSSIRIPHLSMPQRITVWLLAPVIVFLPLLWLNLTLFFGSWDGLFYSNILAMTTDALLHGQWLPRWFAEANGGYGSPVMMFYAPFAYLITAVITLPLILLHGGPEIQFLTGIYASQVFSAYTAWLWLRQKFSDPVAFIGSLLFVLLPYKFIYIYEHFNLAHLWALAFLPLWMIAAEKMAEGDGRAVGFYALAFAVVYYTHPLTILAFGAVPVLYVLWFAAGQNRFASYSKLVFTHIFAAGLCAMHAVPQHDFLGWIHAEEFTAGRFSWRQNLYHIDVLLCAYYGIIAALIAIAAWKTADSKTDARWALAWFWITALAGVVFITLPVSGFVWEHIKLLQYLQFPAGRFHCVALMASIYLICMWLTFYPKIVKLAPFAYHPATLAVLLLLFGTATLVRVQHVYATPNDLTPAYIEKVHAARLIYTVVPVYKTHWGCIALDQAMNAYQNPQVTDNTKVTQGRAEITVKRWHPPELIMIAANVTSELAVITFHQCYIPLWQARDETGALLEIEPDSMKGILQITLPKGPHTILFSLSVSPIEYFSRYVSLTTFILCLLISLRPCRLPNKAHAL